MSLTRNVIGLNGTIVPADEAVVSVMDHGFMYGIGLFETFRTYNGIPSLLYLHMDRLHKACNELGMDAPRLSTQGLSRLCQHLKDLLAASGLEDAYIRYTLTAGEGELGLPSGDYDSPQEIIYVKPLPEVSSTLYSKGKSLHLLKTRRNTPEGSIRLKSLHYMNNILAKRELNQRINLSGMPAEGLQLTAEGYVAEGIVSNVFWVYEGRLFTPALAAGILPGVTRSCVLGIARELGLPYEEGLYTWEELRLAEEIFLTNSIQELVPVTSLIDMNELPHEVGSGYCGNVTSTLLQAYRKKARELH